MPAKPTITFPILLLRYVQICFVQRDFQYGYYTVVSMAGTSCDDVISADLMWLLSPYGSDIIVSETFSVPPPRIRRSFPQVLPLVGWRWYILYDVSRLNLTFNMAATRCVRHFRPNVTFSVSGVESRTLGSSTFFIWRRNHFPRVLEVLFSSGTSRFTSDISSVVVTLMWSW